MLSLPHARPSAEAIGAVRVCMVESLTLLAQPCLWTHDRRLARWHNALRAHEAGYQKMQKMTNLIIEEGIQSGNTGVLPL